MHGFANPARFLKIARPATGVAAGVGSLLLLAGVVRRPVRDAARLSAGRDACASSTSMSRPPGSAWRGGRRSRASLIASWSGAIRWPRSPGARSRRAGRGLRRAVPRHRLALGPADLGHLVGMGRAADLDAGPALPLSRLHRAGPARAGARRRRADGGDVRPGRRDQPADHPLFGDLVEHAPPGPVDQLTQRLDRSRPSCCGRCR